MESIIALQEVRAQKARLTGELRELNDRIAEKGMSPPLQERADNLGRGIARLDAAENTADEAWRGELLEGLKSGAFSLESGDGARKDHDVSFDGRSFTAGGAAGLGQAMAAKGFNLRSKPSVKTSAYVTLKANSFPAVTDWARRAPTVVEMGFDARWLWPFLPKANAGQDTTIQDFRQTARTVTGTVLRAVDALTDKANVDVTVTLAAEAIKQLAVTINSIPNQLLESVPQLNAFLSQEGLFQVQSALDTHVMAQIVAASPPFGTTGTTLVDKVRNGVATMRATGANPRIVVLNPTDAAGLDLLADAGGYIFPVTSSGNSSPLWGLRVVERIGAGTEPPYLIDPDMLGVLYLGQMAFDADPYSEFKKNLTTLRVETNALFHVRDANGARRIAAT